MISPWEFALLALAAYRTWKLLADDAVLDRTRGWLFRRLGETSKWFTMISCPWCLGAWIALAWWGAWVVWEGDAVKVAVPFALSAVVGAFAALVTLMQDE